MLAIESAESCVGALEAWITRCLSSLGGLRAFMVKVDDVVVVEVWLQRGKMVVQVELPGASVRRYRSVIFVPYFPLLRETLL